MRYSQNFCELHFLFREFCSVRSRIMKYISTIDVLDLNKYNYKVFDKYNLSDYI